MVIKHENRQSSTFTRLFESFSTVLQKLPSCSPSRVSASHEHIDHGYDAAPFCVPAASTSLTPNPKSKNDSSLTPQAPRSLRTRIQKSQSYNSRTTLQGSSTSSDAFGLIPIVLAVFLAGNVGMHRLIWLSPELSIAPVFRLVDPGTTCAAAILMDKGEDVPGNLVEDFPEELHRFFVLG